MSGDARITRRIGIDPPITWGELFDKPWATDPSVGYPDVVVHLDTTTEVTTSGEVKQHSGVAIVPTEHETSARTLLDEVTRITRTFGVAPDGTPRRFTGFLHIDWVGYGEVTRVVVRDGDAVEVEPQVLWPVDARDPGEHAPDPGTP